ncbi:protein FAR-RED IMPAIRED RESPONSE 1-like, partial [Asparagus officinalis]|uniref:protein FAR-RED IMPAIRED RESPONSE 1-like n=1 Tax=Asparagus officinalis TaxID=4686 RepID=UPI00098E68B6
MDSSSSSSQLKNNSKVLASVASPDKGEALDEAPASEAERSSELSRSKAAAVALTERHTDSGSLPVEDFDMELEDQSGQKLQIGSETDHRGATMGVMPRTKGGNLIDKENIKDALEVLTMAEVSHEVTNRVPHHEIVEPCKGMDFKTQEEAYSYYKKYARSYGFGVSIKASRRSKKTNEFIDVKYACKRHGEKRKLDAIHPRPCLKIGCRAMLHAKRIEDEKWVVHEFIKDHNHEFSPKYAHYLPYHSGITSSQKHDVSTLQAVGVGVSKIDAAMSKQQAGYDNIGCLEKDIRNLVEKEKRLSLQSGDANAIMDFIMHMKEKDPEFFFAIDWDEQHRLKNVFWVHGKGRRNYQIFSDVVSFDTIYITSRYQMPLAPFIGVNNHFQPIILGCALLADESTATFVWLMRTWLTAMGGKTPNVILTDQDKAMKSAIRLVFPNAKHCYCLWHIMRKLPEKLPHVINKHEKFMETFQRCIYRSWTKEQFEERWFSMVEDFELIEDPLLQSLFEEREYWVPAHMRDTFFAGMSFSRKIDYI